MITLPKAITFDCYGTLIDWESAVQRFFEQRLAAHDIEGMDARALQHRFFQPLAFIRKIKLHLWLCRR